MPGGCGLVAWERTLGDLLSDAGYSCAVYGKWHVGEGAGRWPTDHGFVEWYGPPRADTPLFVYFNHSLRHTPVIPRLEFKGRSGRGEWADALLELDADFGLLLDLLGDLGVLDDTIVVFAGDDGPEDVLLWHGTAGYREGSYFAGGEGNLRTPCLVRRPGHIPPRRSGDEI